jgi:hypothetical protein
MDRVSCGLSKLKRQRFPVARAANLKDDGAQRFSAETQNQISEARRECITPE